MSLLRVRFHADHDDPRPLNFPVEHPYWITGQGNDYSVVVSYADNLEYIKENWPEANNIEAQQVDGYVFTDRFSKPQWWEVIQLRAEVARLTAKLQSAKSEVDEILRAALSGDYDRYLNYDLQGNKYCKWGVVSRDIAAVFDVTEPSDIDVSEQGFND